VGTVNKANDLSVDSSESVDADAVYKEYLQGKYERKMEELLA